MRKQAFSRRAEQRQIQGRHAGEQNYHGAMKSGEERVRLDAAKYYTARRMGWIGLDDFETSGVMIN